MNMKRKEGPFYCLLLSRHLKFILLVFAILPILGCGPVTFSRKSRIDFSKYRNIFVSRVTINGAEDDWYKRYLHGELENDAGFKSIVSDHQSADLVLSLSITVSNRDDKFDSTAIFEANEPGGKSVLSGTQSDSSDSEEEAIEDSIDEVVLKFIPSYRI